MTDSAMNLLIELRSEVEQLKQLKDEIRSPAAPSNGLKPGETLGHLFERYAKTEAYRRVGGVVYPDKVFYTYRYQILRLPFVHEEQTMTFENLPSSALTIRMAKDWRETLIRTPKAIAYPAERLRVRRKYARRKAGEPKPPSNPSNELYSDSTIDRIVTLFQSVIRWAVGGKEMPSPLAGLPRQRKGEDEERARKGYFKDEAQLKYFLQFCNVTLAEMLRLVVRSGGMRKNEARLLTVDQVTDWEEGVILLKGKAAQRPGTKNRKDRRFPVVPEDLEMLKRRRLVTEQLPECTCDEMAKPGPHRHLFPDPRKKGEPVNGSTLGEWMRYAQDDSELRLDGERPVFHHGRHTWATWGLAFGVPLPTLMREGGWSDPKIAMGYAKQAAEAVGESRLLRQGTIEGKREELAAKSAVGGKGR